MGLFSQKQQEPSTWAALPGEPLDEKDDANRLVEPPTSDLLGIGLGAQYSTVVLPAEPPAPEAADTTNAEGDN